jgi:hypothetical protein
MESERLVCAWEQVDGAKQYAALGMAIALQTDTSRGF